jgi:hypothetical protein
MPRLPWCQAPGPPSESDCRRDPKTMPTLPSSWRVEGWVRRCASLLLSGGRGEIIVES